MAHFYTNQEIEWLKEHVRGTPFKKLTQDFNAQFQTNLEEKSICNACINRGLTNGIDRRFKKGSTPLNKNRPKTYLSPKAQEKCQDTYFKKGHLPANTAPLGTERESGGYMQVKVSEKRNDSKKNWRLKHHLIYEKEIGLIPKGWVVIFIDGDRHNFDPTNLMAVPKRAVSVFNKKYGFTQDREQDKTNWLLARLEAETNYREKKR